MKIVLFDLGDTLEDQENDVLLPGAREILQAIQAMRDSSGEAPVLALVSDFDMAETPDQIPAIRKRYFAILDRLGIRSFFEPVSRTVTLSTDVGVGKPDARVFQAVLDKIDKRLVFTDVMFITENLAHVKEARRLKMTAVHLKGPKQAAGEVDKLLDLVPLISKHVENPA